MRLNASFAARLVASSTLSIVLSSCDSPSSPSSTRSPASSPQGQLTLRSITPASGAVLAFRECGFDGLEVMCNDEPRASVDVEIHQDVVDPALDLAFHSVSTKCGSLESRREIARPLQAGRHSFDFAGAFLYATGRTAAPDCPLPSDTTHLVLTLWEVGSGRGTPVMVQHIAYRYRLEKR
jgi:hypothetical protein